MGQHGADALLAEQLGIPDVVEGVGEHRWAVLPLVSTQVRDRS